MIQSNRNFLCYILSSVTLHTISYKTHNAVVAVFIIATKLKPAGFLTETGGFDISCIEVIIQLFRLSNNPRQSP